MLRDSIIYESGSSLFPDHSDEVRLNFRFIATNDAVPERDSGSDVIDLFGEMSSAAGPTPLSPPSLTASEVSAAFSRPLVLILGGRIISVPCVTITARAADGEAGSQMELPVKEPAEKELGDSSPNGSRTGLPGSVPSGEAPSPSAAVCDGFPV